MKKLIVSSVVLFFATASVQGADIVWVSFHPSETMAGPGAAGVGFTTPPDIGYTSLLSSVGHNVSRILTADNVPSQTTLDTLNAADLVIISRSVNSGHYQTDAEATFWNTAVTSPIIAMSGYVLRGGATAANQRLGYFTGSDLPDLTGTRRLLAVQPSHPVFQGVTLDGNNETGDVLQVVTSPVNGATQRGTSIPNNPVAPSGTQIAAIAGGAPGATGTVIAEWEAGDAIDPQVGADLFAGRRMAFISGSREVDGVSSETAGIIDLTPLGRQIFLNAVAYMSSPPVPLVPGDTDGDMVVELSDFNPIRDNFRKTVTMRNQGDLVPNGKVDFADFRQWKSAFLGGGGSLAGVDLGFAANVPEPGTGAQIVLAIALLLSGKQARRTRHSFPQE